MSQIMRLRRIAGSDHHIDDSNNGYRHEHAFVKNIRAERPAARSRPPARLLRRQVPSPRGAGADQLAADRVQGHGPRQDDARQGARAPAQGLPRRSSSIFKTVEERPERVELNLYVSGIEESEPEPLRDRKRELMKVAYWPGCVSRGFTPELHGSMAKVAPLLDIELIPLDRACCTGAGVIAEHNQELADTLNARTFALAQQTDGQMMMNICSTCQGAQGECQERLDGNSEYRAHINETLARRVSPMSAGSRTRTSCGSSSRRSGSTCCVRGSFAH